MIRLPPCFLGVVDTLQLLVAIRWHSGISSLLSLFKLDFKIYIVYSLD